MTINSITYPPVSDESLLKPQDVAADEEQKSKQKETNDVQKPQSGVLPDHRRFDTYEKSDGVPKEEPETTQCTTNTDKVDAEIKKLREEKKQILQQLKKTVGDAEKQAELEERLSQVNAELQAKDNDAYRKQHATHTAGNAE